MPSAGKSAGGQRWTTLDTGGCWRTLLGSVSHRRCPRPLMSVAPRSCRWDPLESAGVQWKSGSRKISRAKGTPSTVQKLNLQKIKCGAVSVDGSEIRWIPPEIFLTGFQWNPLASVLVQQKPRGHIGIRCRLAGTQWNAAINIGIQPVASSAYITGLCVR
ncbi:hypothetical protein R3P38DRAFT_2786453 [Favolaschia claudopus]|uniref:Uncharacterized protein n=1 Tax=Favolaschia claudopus TaxID=2862362 RepID=A0AAW0ARQ8_9AGAR